MYGIHFTYGSYGSKLTINLQFYKFTNLNFLIKLNDENTYNYNYNVTILHIYTVTITIISH